MTLPGYVQEVISEYGVAIIDRERYDGCIIGLGWRHNDGPVLVYDLHQILTVLREEGMTMEEAIWQWRDRYTHTTDAKAPIFVYLS